MKIIIAISLMLISTFALACSDLSGAYDITQNPIILKQIDCSSLAQMSSAERDSFSIRIDGKKHLVGNFTYYDFETEKLLNVDRYATAAFKDVKLVIDNEFLVIPIRGGQLKIIKTKTDYSLNTNNDLVITYTESDGGAASYTYERY